MLFNSFTFIVFFITVSIFYYSAQCKMGTSACGKLCFLYGLESVSDSAYLVYDICKLFFRAAYLFGKKGAAQKTHFNIFNACGFWPAVYF